MNEVFDTNRTERILEEKLRNGPAKVDTGREPKVSDGESKQTEEGPKRGRSGKASG